MKKSKLLWMAATLIVLLLVLSACSCKHEYDQWQTVQNASCTTEGVEERVCTKCEEKETRPIAMLAHAYGEWSVVKEASCTEVGSRKQICTGCNKVNTEEIEKMAHAWVAATCTTPKTCASCNATEGKTTAHTYDDMGKCTVCKTENPKLTELKERVTIYGTFLSVNSADGVSMYITWENESTKEIKYITFTVQLFNKVNDPIVCDIRNKSKEYLEQTGPIPQGKGMYTSARTDATGYAAIFKNERVTFAQFKEDEANGWAEQRWSNVWYNSSAYYAKVVGVQITYMDGTSYSCQEQKLFDCIGALYLNRSQNSNAY